ncbi:MAG: hypothetical protein JNK66_12115 [Chitinophagales bacterium]|nr:hypothetical protein [Chitinophagales bacterium]
MVKPSKLLSINVSVFFFIVYAITLRVTPGFAQAETQNTSYPFWKVIGNAGTNPSNNFIGTTDAVDWVIRTNNTERARVLSGGNTGIGTPTPGNLLTINHAGTTAATLATYPFAISRNNSVDITAGSDASYAYFQSWNTKPLLLNSQGNFIGINKTTAPIQHLDINGRLNVNNGVIQRGTTQINGTSDLGLYSQIFGSWVRVASHFGPIKFYFDQGGFSGVGTSALVNMESANGGGVAIGANMGGATDPTPNARAILDLQSTEKGFLPPRLTTTQRDAMGNVLAEGLMIYNTTNDCLEWWDTKATPNGGNGFWNSVCDYCQNTVIITSNQTGYNLNTALGGGKSENYCVYIQSGVTLQAAGNGGTSGAAGNPGFNASTMPSGAKIKLFNYGTILAGGGNGGIGARESDGICQGDLAAGVGGAGGHAILTNAGVAVTVFNYGTIRAGGGGGGGAGAGCCSAGGGGGGGAGTPAGSGGAGSCYNCTGGTICGCGNRTGCSGAGAAGGVFTAGTGGVGAGSSSSGCSGNSNGGTGATGGVPGVAGSNQTTGCCVGGCAGAVGGAAGLALQGNGSGSSLSNLGGTVTGSVNP